MSQNTLTRTLDLNPEPEEKTIKKVGIGSEIGDEEDVDLNETLGGSETYRKAKTSTARRRRNLWAKKHRKHRKHAKEHNKDPNWFKHEKHFIIVSWAGRPIYTRYGDDTLMAAYMGVVTAIISNVSRTGDTLRSIRAGDHKFVFLLKGPIYLMAISKTTESIGALRMQLEYAHAQIISVLTLQVHRILEERPGTDIRNLMGGTENLLSDLISESDRNPSFMLDAVMPLRMPRTVRSRVASALRKGKTKSLLYAILLAGSRVVNIIRGKDRDLHPSDLLLCINFVTNSQSLRSSESWTPICLPKVSEMGYLYAYVCYIAEDICLTMITCEANDFKPLRDCKQKIVEALEKRDCLHAIEEAMNSQDLLIDELETHVPELRHFLYKQEGISQFITPAPASPYIGRDMQKHLFRRYQHIHSRIYSNQKDAKHHAYSIYYEVTDSATMIAWIRADVFAMYATFTPLVSKESVIMALNRIHRYIKSNEASLFIL